MHLLQSFPLAVALKSSLRGYTFKTFRDDVLAAFVVSLLAMPLSMALSIAVGMPPQYGLYTAIVAGVVVPLLGGSRWQVSGPTAAFVVILAPIVTEFGPRGIIWAGLMAGAMLLAMGYARLGKLIYYIPYPVTAGFTAGIAMVLAILSLNDFLGLGITRLDGGFAHKLMLIGEHLPNTNIFSLEVGVVTLFLLFFAGRVIKFLPSAIIAILVGALLALLLNDSHHRVATIGSTFSYVTGDGIITPGIPPYPPQFHLPNRTQGDLYAIPRLEELQKLLFPAMTIALLAALESLLSATVADSMAGTRHEPNAELGAIGIGNVLTALVGGIAATGAIARTAALINNGAKTPIASCLHALLILLYMMLLAPYISYIPMAALAALLIHTAYRMSHYKQCIRILKIAPRSDVVVLLACFSLTVFVDMVAGVGVGMVCASFLLIRRVTELTDVDVSGDKDEQGVQMVLATPLPEGTYVYRIRGPIFFATIEKAFDRYNFAHDYIKRVIIDMTQVPFIDMTGLVALKSMLATIAHEKRSVHIVCDDADIAEKIRFKLDNHMINRYVYIRPTMEAALQD